MTILKRLLSLWALLALAACGGGGGDAGTSPLTGGGGTGGGGTGGGGTTTTGPSVSLSISSATITPQSPATITATVRDGNGNPVSGVVVALSTGRSDVGTLTAISVLTNANGTGSAGVQAAGTGVTGADEITAVATLGTTTVSSKIGFAVTGASATVAASITSTTLRASTGAATFTAIVRDAAGAPLAGQIVNFASASNRVQLGVSSALTDGSGTASTTASPANGSVGVADTLIASAIVNGRSLQSSVNVQVIPESPTVQVSLTGTSASPTAPVTVTASVRDSANNPVANTVVSFSTQFGLGSFSTSTAATNTQGIATVTVATRQAGTAGADVVIASATVAGVTRTDQQVIEFVAGTASAGPTVQVALSSGTVTVASPVTVTATLRDGSGTVIPNAVVTFSTLRANLTSLAANSVLTGTDGRAAVALRSTGSGIEGADEVIATASVGGATVQGRAGFAVTAQAPTLSWTPSSSTLRFSTAPLTLTARVLDATGAAVANQPVSFSAGALVVLGTPSALTDGSGNASVTVRPTAPTTSGAELVTATATVAGRSLQAQASVQITAEAPRLDVASISSSSIGATTPATLRVIARGLDGNLLPGAVVSFSSSGNLASFSPATQVTDVNGEAATVVSPRTAASAGADTLNATVTVQGVAARAQQVVQFTSSTPSGTPTLDLALSTTSISAASPATVTATLRDAQGQAVPSQVVSFSVVRDLAVTNIGTALTNSQGAAIVVLSPSSSTSAGADEITASASYAGVTLQRTQGFQVQATAVTLGALTAAANPLSAYGQTTLSLPINGASVTSPVNISLSSACVTQGKATLSPASFTATSTTATIQYRDNGCGAIQPTDQIQAVVTATGTTASLSLAIASPAESSIAFVQASPEQIFLRGSGFTESSVVTFEVRDAAGNPLPNRVVELRLQTGAGGVTMEGRGVELVNPPSPDPFTLTSNALGRVSVRVNSGTLPTPVRVNARLAANTAIATVSSNLSVAVGLPSQLNFSLSQETKNIEGYDIDGTSNAYTIIASDRSGNPVPDGTSINFVAEGGQIQAVRQIQAVGGIAKTAARFESAEPRPVDGRVTITVYALGEESFLDLNGNNAYDSGEPFQDLGSIFKDRNFDGSFLDGIDETIPLTPVSASGAACVAPGNNLLNLDTSMPSRPATCDGRWSGAGQVYVRRSIETVLSTSTARPLWASTRGLARQSAGGAVCASTLTMQVGTDASPAAGVAFVPVAGDTWYSTATSDTLNFIVADANPGSASRGLLPRLNPMAAGTVISATTTTPGLTVAVGGGSPVSSTTEATGATISYSFTDPTASSGVVFVTFRSPSGLGTTVTVPVVRGAVPTTCPVP